MSFRERMFTETGAPMPRWLYLFDKAAHTTFIAVALMMLLGLTPLIACIIAVLVYVGDGLYNWNHTHRESWWGPGSYTGDAGYHLTLSLIAPALLLPPTWLLRMGCVGIVLLLWWICDTAGLGPSRSP